MNLQYQQRKERMQKRVKEGERQREVIRESKLKVVEQRLKSSKYAHITHSELFRDKLKRLTNKSWCEVRSDFSFAKESQCLVFISHCFELSRIYKHYFSYKKAAKAFCLGFLGSSIDIELLEETALDARSLIIEDKIKLTDDQRRRVIFLCACPEWRSKEKIQMKYNERDILNKMGKGRYKVKHIFPVHGKGCCGLHVDTNLKVIETT